MTIRVFADRSSIGSAAANHAAASIRRAVYDYGAARVVVASAASQFEFLESLTNIPGIDWSCVELFHLDEYIGIPISHPASFCKFLQERLVNKTGITKVHFPNGNSDPAETIRIAGEAVLAAPIDVVFVGIGENGHLAFNDPPADFDTEAPYIDVALDEACRQPQIDERWFAHRTQRPFSAPNCCPQYLELRKYTDEDINRIASLVKVLSLSSDIPVFKP